MSVTNRLGIEDIDEYQNYASQITYRFRSALDDGALLAEIDTESFVPIPDEGDRISLKVSKADFDEDEQNWGLAGSESLGSMVVTSVNYRYNYLFFERSAGSKGQRFLTEVDIWGEPIQME